MKARCILSTENHSGWMPTAQRPSLQPPGFIHLCWLESQRRGFKESMASGTQNLHSCSRHLPTMMTASQGHFWGPVSPFVQKRKNNVNWMEYGKDRSPLNMFNVKLWTKVILTWVMKANLRYMRSKMYSLKSSPFGCYLVTHEGLPGYFKDVPSTRWGILHNTITWVQNKKCHQPSTTRRLCSKQSKQRNRAPPLQHSRPIDLMPRRFPMLHENRVCPNKHVKSTHGQRSKLERRWY